MRDDYYVYILTNYSKTVLYTGTTHDLLTRLLQHYSNRGSLESFTSKYSCFYLIWYDSFPTMREAIETEKYIKGKNRVWKEDLIAGQNHKWRFLNEDIVGVWPPDQELMKNISK